MTGDSPHPLLKRRTIEGLPEVRHTHQFNPNAVRHTVSLTDGLGFEHMGVHLVRVEPGHDSTEFHTHGQDEEFVYILEGRGIAHIGNEQFEVAPGDFMGFAAGSPPHAMHNAFDEDLVYLMGGTRSEIDVCDYPRIERRMYRIDGKREYAEWSDVHPVNKPTGG